MNVVVTTLGRARKFNGENAAVGRYKTLSYKFGNVVSAPTAFFGKALFDHLSNDVGERIDKVVILGTSGSMWDAWLEIDECCTLYEQHEDLYARLERAVAEDRQDVAALAELESALQEYLGCQVHAVYIPYGMDVQEQTDILKAISNECAEGDAVYMDVTHGLRHLPIIELLSAFLMRSKLTRCSLYYGAAERQQCGTAPVVELEGAVRINDWTNAIEVLRCTGNVSLLSQLPGMESFKDDLEKCQFFEQMNNVPQSRRFARSVFDRLDKLPIEATLFKAEIADAFSWSSEQHFAMRQFLQAQKAYVNGDYLRSVILLMESVISANIVGDAGNGEIRQKTQENLNRQHDENWHILRKLRNSLAHGGAPEGRGAEHVIRMRGDATTFRREYAKLLKWAETKVKAHG